RRDRLRPGGGISSNRGIPGLRGSPQPLSPGGLRLSERGARGALGPHAVGRERVIPVVTRTVQVQGIELPWQRLERYGENKGALIEEGTVFVEMSTLYEL